MASTDARPVPIKNTAYRAVFPILDADGDLVTGATGLDSEVSKDQGTFSDCTNEATEIATSSGMYYLDLTADEMNADCVAVIVKTSSSGAKTTVLVLYPEEAGDINVDVTAFGGVAGTFSGGRPEVNTTHAAGTAWNSGAIGASTLASDTITAAKIAADAITDAKVASDVTIASVTGAVGSVTGAVGSVTGNVGGSVASIATGGISAASFASGAIDAAAIAADAIGSSELAASAITEIQAGLSTLDAAGVRTAVGLASANLDTQLDALPTAAENADAVWDEATSGHVTAGTFGQGAYIIRANTAQAGGATTITLDASASATNDVYNYALVVLTAGTGAGQARYITDYVGSTKVATVASWQTNPDNTSVFVILPGGQIPGATAPTAGEVADAVWDEATSGHTTAGTFGKLSADVLEDTGTTLQSEVDGIQADTEDIQARLPAALVSGRIDASVGAMAANVMTAAAAASDLTTELQSGLATAASLSSLDTKIGTPAGASVSADILTLDNLVDDLESRIGTPSNLGSGATVAANLVDIEGQTDEIGAAGAGLTAVPWNASWDAEVQSEVTDALEVTLSDSVPADGTLPTVKQALYMLTQFMLERSVSGTTVTVKKADGSTSLFTLTLNDATTPTSITRAS